MQNVMLKSRMDYLKKLSSPSNNAAHQVHHKYESKMKIKNTLFYVCRVDTKHHQSFDPSIKSYETLHFAKRQLTFDDKTLNSMQDTCAKHQDSS